MINKPALQAQANMSTALAMEGELLTSLSLDPTPQQPKALNLLKFVNAKIDC